MSEANVYEQQVRTRSLIVGLLIPLLYQIGLTIFAFAIPLTLVPPAGWVGLHMLTGVLFLVCPLLAVRLPIREAWRTLGGRSVSWTDGTLAVLIGLLCITIVLWVYDTVVFLLFHAQPDFGFPQSSQDVVPFVLLVVVTGPLGEEVFFRGYFGSLFPKKWQFLLISSTVWAVLHIDPIAFLTLFWTGLVLAYMRFRTHSFYPPLLLHMLINVVALLMYYWK